MKALGDRVSIEHHLQPATKGDIALTSPSWNPALTPFQLVVAGVLCALTLAVGGLYLFYPPADSLIYDMNDIRVDFYDAVDNEDVKESRRRLLQWRTQAEKLTTSVLIREGSGLDNTERSGLRIPLQSGCH